MRVAIKLVATVVVLVAFSAIAEEKDPKADALSWQKQATDTRATVVGVAEEIQSLGVEKNPVAKGQFDDAVRWLGKGDESLAKADKAMEAADFKPASQDYNMAWQYYVKAATAGLLARGMLTDE